MLETLTRRLLAQAYLFDDPGAYEAGVQDALASLHAADLLRDTRVTEEAPPPASALG